MRPPRRRHAAGLHRATEKKRRDAARAAWGAEADVGHAVVSRHKQGVGVVRDADADLSGDVAGVDTLQGYREASVLGVRAAGGELASGGGRLRPGSSVFGGWFQAGG